MNRRTAAERGGVVSRSGVTLAVAGLTAVLALCLSACGSTSPNKPAPGARTSVVTAPVHIARTAMGNVVYRMLGAGPPLVLIMGYSGTMETWDPVFVDTLARHFRVVVFDNSGLGGTQAVSGPLSIDAMADQSAALIRSLRLAKPDVLGWSMGSMIAQALAIRHPDDVGKLVLAASYPGAGNAVIPAQATLDALNSGQPSQLGGALFPADQAFAFGAYAGGLAVYPAAKPASASTITAQGAAVLDWWHGADPAGHHAATLSAPTLIGDGTQDALDDSANTRALGRLIPGATVRLYPDAGHAFLFQVGTPFGFLVESFLGEPSTAAPLATIRSVVSRGTSRFTAARAAYQTGPEGRGVQPDVRGGRRDRREVR